MSNLFRSLHIILSMNAKENANARRQREYRERTGAKLESYERIVNLIRECELKELAEKREKKRKK